LAANGDEDKWGENMGEFGKMKSRGEMWGNIGGDKEEKITTRGFKAGDVSEKNVNE
jgi:hypothetical protein